MTDPRQLADRLDHRATQNAIVRSYGIMPSSHPEDDDLDRAAAALLRHHANLLDAIGDPDILRHISTVRREDRYYLRRIANAATNGDGQ
jgi:hypothetical protein